MKKHDPSMLRDVLNHILLIVRVSVLGRVEKTCSPTSIFNSPSSSKARPGDMRSLQAILSLLSPFFEKLNFSSSFAVSSSSSFSNIS